MRASRSLRRLAGFAALAALPFVASVARGDADETERRLKAIGVDAGLREKVHKAINRGVAFLLARQQPDGWFFELGGGEMNRAYSNNGVTLLCALALRHAGTPATDVAVRRAIAIVYASGKKSADDIEQRVYEAGLALMLFASVPGHEKEARRIATALALGLDEASGIWGYRTPGAGDGSGRAAPFDPRATSPNVSTTQFAALGLAAARRMGIPVPTNVWVRHSEGLCAMQAPNGSWRYGPEDSLRLSTTTTNTYMGLANLLLAEQALKDAKDVPVGLPEKLARAIQKARGSLVRGASRTFPDPRAEFAEFDDETPPERARVLSAAERRLLGLPPRQSASPGLGAYYTLFALEKACLFANIESIEVSVPLPKDPKPGARPKTSSLAWYAKGAEWLIAIQRDDGGWSPNAGDPPGDDPSEVDTALALLFLLRSPSVFHPTTPTEVDAKPRGPVTEGDPKPPAK